MRRSAVRKKFASKKKKYIYIFSIENESSNAFAEISHEFEKKREKEKKLAMKCMLGLAHSTTYDFFCGFHLLDSNKFLVNDPGVVKYSDLLSDLLACLPNCQPTRIKNERSWPGRFYTTGCQSDLSAYVRRVRKYPCPIDIGLDTFVYHRLISHGIEKRVGQLKEKWNGEIFNSRVSDCIAPPISKNCCCDPLVDKFILRLKIF